MEVPLLPGLTAALIVLSTVSLYFLLVLVVAGVCGMGDHPPWEE